MKLLKRLAAGIVSVAMAATMLTGCDSGRYVMSYDGNDINSGIYIYNIISEMLSQQYTLYIKGSSDGVMDQKVDGKEMAVYLEDKAMEKTKEYCAVTEKFEELGLELTDEELKTISTSATNTYNAQKDLFEELGISKESIKLALKGAEMKTKIFNYYYGKDGKEAPSEDEMIKYVTDSYLRYKSITISKSTKTDDSEKEKENKEKKELADKYFKLAESKSFTSFDDVIDAYKKETEEASKAASGDSSTGDSSTNSESQADSSSSSESTADSSSGTDSSAVESDSSKVGDNDSSSSSAAESSSSESKAESSSAADSSSNDDTSSSADSSSKDDTSSSADSSSAADTSTTGTTKTEASKYPNETMQNYAKLTKEQLETNDGKMVTKIKDMEKGKAALYEDDYGYYIIIKGDTSERSKGYVSENNSTILDEMFSKTLDEKIAKWAEDLNIKVDKNAIKKYSAKSLYDRYAAFVTKDSKTKK